MQQAISTKADTTWQAQVFGRNSDTCYPHGHKVLKNKEFKDRKNSEAKKTMVFLSLTAMVGVEAGLVKH